MDNYIIPRIDSYRGINIGICLNEEDKFPGVVLYKDKITPRSVKVYLLKDNSWDRSHHTRVRKGIPADKVDEVVNYINKKKNEYCNVVFNYYKKGSDRFSEDAYFDSFGNYHVVKYSSETDYLFLKYNLMVVFKGNQYDNLYDAINDNKEYFKQHSIYELLELKFSNHELEQKLLSTGNGTIMIAYRLDIRSWHMKGFFDTGPNCLGTLLTRLRNEIRRDKICQI